MLNRHVYWSVYILDGMQRKTMAEVLKEAIERDGRSLYAIAKAAGMTYPPLYRFAHDQQGLRLETADKLATALGLVLRQGKEDELGID